MFLIDVSSKRRAGSIVVRGYGGKLLRPRPLGGTIGGKKKRSITFAKVVLFVHTRKPQGARCACDRKQSFLTPHIGEAL